jgi:hypothetical protein
MLKDCKDDKELFQAAADIFKKLYPEPKVVTGWRGNEIEVDWLYAFTECFHMAHLHRWPSDFVEVKDVLIKMGIIK